MTVINHVANEAKYGARLVRAQADVNPFVQRLRTATPAEINSWIDTNVTDLASAKGALKYLAIAVALLYRRA